MSNESNGSPSCPVKAPARRAHHIMCHGLEQDIIGTHFTGRNATKRVITERHVNDGMKTAVRATGLQAKGFPPEPVGGHSLRAGGAMAMHLNGVDTVTMRKQGRWSSDTFLMCIHEQVSAFSADLSGEMANAIGWQNIAGPEVLNDPDDLPASAA